MIKILAGISEVPVPGGGIFSLRLEAK